MIRPLFLFSVSVGAIAAILVAASDGFAWAMAVMGMLVSLALVLFLAAEMWPIWPESPLQADERRRRQRRTILDVLHDDMRGGL